MHEQYIASVRDTLAQIKADGFYKAERVISTPQASQVRLGSGPQVLISVRNYLGLADDARLIAVAKEALDTEGFGMASVRFICGTQTVHKRLEHRLADFLGFENTILYSSCFDANGGLFETLLSDADAIISDELKHASIIDGVRISKARRLRYRNNDMADLEVRLQEADAAGARYIT